MAKIYVSRCIVKRNGKTYPKGKVIKDLTEEEIKQGLSESWLTAVADVDEDDDTDTDTDAGKEAAKPAAKPTAKTPAAKKNNDKKKDPEPDLDPVTERDELIAKATELGIADLIVEETPIEEIRQMVAEAQDTP